MSCLENYISVKYCGLDAPGSDLYVNDLAGISLKSIDATANSEQLTFFNVWKDAEKRAIKRLTTGITNELLKRFKIKKLIEYYKGWKSNINTISNQTSASTVLRGFFVTLGDKSEMLTISVQELSFYLKANGNATINVYDTSNDSVVLIDSFDIIDGLIGWNRVVVNKSYFGVKSLFFGVANKDSVYLPISDNDSTIQGGSISADLETQTFVNNSYGLTGIISIGCSYDSFICNNKKLFSSALLYACGYELLTERIFSERLNRFTTVDAKLARELRDEYANNFNNELSLSLSGVTFKQDCCLECNEQLTLANNLP